MSSYILSDDKEYLPAFSNGTEFESWTARNCDRCVKASRYKEDTDTYTQYRCAIQRDIDLEAAGLEPASPLLAYQICQKPDCLYLKLERSIYKRKSKYRDQPSLFES